ncbi:prolyl oligopeptidase family serine peptidase [Gammaproteobacteria bacterium]|nr:prolyl oligopeptidase family serine peptidase [Gammaproteobacteria bacterium]MDC3066570.1 prolyl oligopeptidase family serine peptidase [Gammaproteobacteria bacterium]
MYKLCLNIFLILIIISCSNQKTSGYPETKKEEFTETIHGYEISDSYRWLEDFTSNDSLDWVKRQNKFTKTFISKNNYKKDIANYLEQIWENESISIPYKEEGKTFYYFNDGSFQQSKLMIKDCDKCDERVLIDPNTFSDDGTISLGGTSVNNSADMIAFSISDGGSDWRVWKVLDIETGEVLEDEIKWAKFSGASWENDDSGFFYQKYDEPQGELLKEVNESPKLMFHKIGTDQSEDYVVYENPDQPRWGWGINVIEDSNIKILSISEGTDERNRLYIQLNAGEKFIPLIDELIGAYSFIDSKDGILWFYTTEGAPNGKIVNLEIKNGSFVWNDVIQESKNSIRSVNVINNSFVINYLVDTFSSIKIFDLSGNFVQDLELPKNGTIGGFGGEIDDTETYFSISNYVTPREIYEINLDTLDVNLFWKEEIDGYESEDYVSELKFYPSKDGTKIPIHISYKKGLEINQDTPLMLYGYGGFNISLLPGFRKTHAAWKNLGGVYAVANLRGGGEYGSEWHEAGMLLNKQNVFDDFAFAAKFLHENNIGSEKTTAIIGGSNGGLLVAATMLQNPDLFKVAIPQVGVLDMLRFSKFTIGWAWESDYGSVDKKDEFENLLAYSPLHNIEKDKCYPTTLVTTASRDDRVVPSHSYKFAAKLQEYQGCENPILIRIEDRAGHGAGTPKDKIINQISEIYGYALKEISN